MKKILAMITCAAENYTLDIIKSSFDYFDRIIVVDGNFDWWDERDNPYHKFLEEKFGKEDNSYHTHIENVDNKNSSYLVRICEGEYKLGNCRDKLWIVSRPWNDNYAEAYMAHLNLLQEGDWVLIVDSDEYPGELLKQNLDKIIQESNNGENFDIVMLPVVDFLDDKMLWEETDVPQQYVPGIWTKHILLRKGIEPVKLRYFGSHVIPLGEKYSYYPFPYYHKKKLQDFIEGEPSQWVLCPEGQLVDPIDAALFRTACQRSNIKTMNDMKMALTEGKLSPELEMLAIKNRDKRRSDGGLHPWAQVYASYFLLHGPKIGKFPPDNKYTLESIYDEIKKWKINNHTYKNFGYSCINIYK